MRDGWRRRLLICAVWDKGVFTFCKAQAGCFTVKLAASWQIPALAVAAVAADARHRGGQMHASHVYAATLIVDELRAGAAVFDEGIY